MRQQIFLYYFQERNQFIPESSNFEKLNLFAEAVSRR